GIRMLLNECETIERNGQRIYLAGIDDAHFFRVDNIEKAASQIPDGGFSILLSHTPEIYRQAAHAGFSLLLSGHTHGGQICLPGSIPITLDSVLPRRMGQDPGNITPCLVTPLSESDRASLPCVSSWTPLIIPNEHDQTVYLIVDDFGRQGLSFHETNLDRTDPEAVITDLIAGQYDNPNRVVAFNIAERRANNVSEDIAREIRRRADRADEDVSSSIKDFVVRHAGRERQLVLRLV
ncbi:metallophosphoesterase, partial [Rhodoferax sp.]|uniref:metallophosphoesterase n=1 Tax=Rhodoferax sp. TaxID=50421 RepID=UPI003BB71FB2